MIECANHKGRAAFGVCAKCGKPFCAECLTMTSAGRMLCLSCLAAEQTKAEQPAAAVEARCEAEAPAAVVPPVEAEAKPDAAENAVEAAPVESEAAESEKEARRRKKKELNRLTNDIYFEKYQVMLFIESLGWLIILVLSLIWCGTCIGNLNDAKRSLYNPDIWTAEWILAASIICAGVHVLFCPMLLDKFPFGIAVTLRVISLRLLGTVMNISLNYFRDIDYVSLGVDELFINFNMIHFIAEALSLYFLDKARLKAREKLEPETCVPIWKRGFFGGEKKKKEAETETETEKNV